MTFQEAKENLHLLAGERFCSLKFEEMGYGGKLPYAVRCSCYIDGVGWTADCHSFESALYDLTQLMRSKEAEELILMEPTTNDAGAIALADLKSTKGCDPEAAEEVLF